MTVTILFSSIVGSRLQGLATEESDLDLRRVIVFPMTEALSPFPVEDLPLIDLPSNLPGNVTVEAESFELGKFCRLLTHANPTALEILWSDLIVEAHPASSILRANRHAFLGSRKILEASRGYAASQLRAIEHAREAGRDNGDVRRAGKAMTAYTRVLWQACMLLETGDFPTQPNEDLRALMMVWKRLGLSDDRFRKFNSVRSELELRLDRAFEQNVDRFTTNYPLVKQIIAEIYLLIHAESSRS